MSLHRFFIPEPLAASTLDDPMPVPLTPDDLHHVGAVLRLRAGDEIVVVAPDRVPRIVRITQLGEHGVLGFELETLPATVEPRVTLVQGLAKGDKLDLVVEKVTEIGIEAVVPVAFARSVVKLDAERGAKRGERLRRVAQAAAKQAQRSYVPSVSDPVAPTELAGILGSYDIVLVAWEEALDAPGIGAALRQAGAHADSRIAIVIGPEGGLTTAEVGSLTHDGAIVVSLGPNVLRTETAGILSAALCVYESGGLGGRVSD